MNRNAILAFSGGLLMLVAAFIVSIQYAHATTGVLITPVTGGTAISADTTGGAYTSLGDLILVESNPGDIDGDVTLSAPAGFMFDASSTVTITVNSGDIRVTSPVGPGGMAGGSIVMSVASSSSVASSITVHGLAVRPTSGTPLATGSILISSGAGYFVSNHPSAGTLTEVAGAAASVNVETAANGSGTTVGAQTINAAGTVTAYGVTRDQFGNYVGNPSDTTWSLTSVTGDVVQADLTPTTSASTILTGNGTGSATIHAANASLVAGNSGTITVHGNSVYVNPTTGNDANDGSSVSPVQTIAHALSIVPSGGFIHLAAGTYDEGTSEISITKNVTIEGPNASISPNTGSRSGEAVIVGTSTSANTDTFGINAGGLTVAFKGLTFETGAEPIRTDYSGSTIDLEKNIFTGHSTVDYIQITAANTLTIDDNKFASLTIDGGDSIQVGGGSATISNNTWSNNSASALNLSGVSGTVSANTFSNIQYYGVLVASNANLTITGNTFNSITNPDPSNATWGAGVRFYDDVTAGTTASITNNTFTNNYRAISVKPGADVSGVTIQHNDINGNTIGVLHAGSATLNVQQNWWGSTTGPTATTTSSINTTGVGDWLMITGGADASFRPWCLASGCATVDTTAPTVSSVSVSPNPAKAGTATITVTFSESTMNTAISPTVTVTGTLGGTLTAAQTSYSGATWTGTVTVPNHLEESTATVNISGSEDTSGNKQVGTDSSYSFPVDSLPPVITSITSVNSGAGSTLKIGDTITFTLTPSKTEAGATVSGSYNGHALVWSAVGGGATYTATYTVTAGDTDHSSPVQITGVTITDAAGNVSSSADGSDVSKGIDANVPTLSSVHIQSNNTHSAYAKTGDTVTITFTSNEQVSTPTVTIAGHAASVTGGPTSWTATYTFGGTETEGAVLISINFSDLAGNAGTQVAATTDLSSVVFDKTAPVIDAHSNIYSVEATSHSGATVTYTAPTARDVIGGNFAATCSLASGSTFGLGTTTVSCNATDNAGNAAATTTFNVGVVDTTAPSITQGDLTREATSSAGVSVTFSPVGSDNYDTSVTVSCTPSSSSLFPLGTTTVNCSTTDSNGNTGHRSFNVGVVDTTAPTLTLTGDATTTIGLNNAYAEPGFTSNDAVDGNITSSVNVTGTVATTTVGTYTLTYSSTDSHGNNTTKTRDVVVSSTTLAVATSTVGSTVVGTLTNPTTESFSSAWTQLTIDTPADLKITGPIGWNGTLELPHQATSFTAPANSDVQNQVEIGFPNTLLTFDKGVRIVLKDMAPSHVGYSRSGVFTEITATCASDSQATGDALPAGGDCRINIGNNAVIWTKHFTTFIGYVPYTTTSGGGGGGGNGPVQSSGGGGGGGGSSAPVTTPTTPAPAPQGQVLGASTYNFTTDLRVGSRGQDVIELQKILIAEGYLSGEPTGYFGGLTRAALVKYQKAHGISPASGLMGPKTRAELSKGSTPTSSDEEKAKKIQSLQALLQSLLQQIATLKAKQ